MGVMERAQPQQHGVHVLPLLSAGPTQYLWERVQASVFPQGKEKLLYSPLALLHLSICVFL